MSHIFETRTLHSLMAECHQTALDKGWWEADKERSFGELVALAHSELSEAFEEYRKFGLDPNRFIYHRYTGSKVSEQDGSHELLKGDKPEGIAVELADLLIRVFDNCVALNIPIEEALRVKMEFNKTRPHRHGGKVC